MMMFSDREGPWADFNSLKVCSARTPRSRMLFLIVVWDGELFLACQTLRLFCISSDFWTFIITVHPHGGAVAGLASRVADRAEAAAFGRGSAAKMPALPPKWPLATKVCRSRSRFALSCWGGAARVCLLSGKKKSCPSSISCGV